MKLGQIKSFLYSTVVIQVLFFASNCFGQQVTERIKLNQLGYYTKAPKLAVVTGIVSSDNFYITSTNLRDTFFVGNLSAPMQSLYSTTTTKIANFSNLTKQGTYVLQIKGVGHSYVFSIGDAVHKTAAISTLKGFYYQRASMPLTEKFAGKWHRSAGHPDNVVYIHPSAASIERPAGTIISSVGGWYDAGDYNKYIVNSGITMGTLLSAYEDFPAYYTQLKTNIPESGNGVPDILNEAIYNLRWMLTMQDPNDGGVYNKCTNAAFDGMIMPGITKEQRYVVQKGTAATLDFAAVTAQASRILQKFNKQLPGLSDSCMHAAQKAWEWAIQHPALAYDQDANNKKFTPAISTGGYGDNHFNDEWLWAASELYVSTKSTIYLKVINDHLNDVIELPSWGNVAMLCYYSLLRHQEKIASSLNPIKNQMKQHLISIADNYIEKSKSNAFNTVMGQSVSDFNWGSNSNAANQGILLINAFLLTGNNKYIDAALNNADYILGRNATGYSFITGIGSKSTMHPHHRPSVADGITEPIPGLLAGGPNPGLQDKCQYEFTEPETAYADIDCAYASNEIAINWNAPIVYLLNALEALQTKVGYTSKGLRK